MIDLRKCERIASQSNHKHPVGQGDNVHLFAGASGTNYKLRKDRRKRKSPTEKKRETKQNKTEKKNTMLFLFNSHSKCRRPIPIAQHYTRRECRHTRKYMKYVSVCKRHFRIGVVFLHLRRFCNVADNHIEQQKWKYFMYFTIPFFCRRFASRVFFSWWLFDFGLVFFFVYSFVLSVNAPKCT